jgi:hypothetical protein
MWCFHVTVERRARGLVGEQAAAHDVYEHAQPHKLQNTKVVRRWYEHMQRVARGNTWGQHMPRNIHPLQGEGPYHMQEDLPPQPLSTTHCCCREWVTSGCCMVQKELFYRS